jgi:deoxyribonuclease V
VGGIDCSYDRRGGEGYAVVVVLGWPDLDEIDMAWVRKTISFPYIPGLLSFREAPLVLEAWSRLRRLPDLIFVDGQGIAHPRSMGLAAHLGLFLDISAIGCAKSSLIGRDPSVGSVRGDSTPLFHQGRAVGVSLRTRTGVKPVYVSAGHLTKGSPSWIDSKTAIELVLRACRGYRIPEPLRRAHVRANRLRSSNGRSE